MVLLDDGYGFIDNEYCVYRSWIWYYGPSMSWGMPLNFIGPFRCLLGCLVLVVEVIKTSQIYWVYYYELWMKLKKDISKLTGSSTTKCEWSWKNKTLLGLLPQTGNEVWKKHTARYTTFHRGLFNGEEVCKYSKCSSWRCAMSVLEASTIENNRALLLSYHDHTTNIP